MIKGDYDYLKNLASINVCSEHKTPLEVAWYGDEKTWVLRCGSGHFPNSITRQLSLTEGYKAGEEFPEPIQSNIKKSIGRRFMQDNKGNTAVTLTGIPPTDLGTGELLAPEVLKALVEYASRYHLDPWRGHVVLMYGKPYVSIDGYLYRAAQSQKAYSLSSRPLKTDELEQYKIGPTDHAWLAEVNLTEKGLKFTGIGIVTYEEMTAKSPRDATKLRSPVVAAHPWQLAQKRAEWQALRRAFPIGETKETDQDGAARASGV